MIVGGLLSSRYSYQEDRAVTTTLQQQLRGGENAGSLSVGPITGIRHYYSQAGDEAMYYELGSIMLGHSVEAEYLEHAKRRGGRKLGYDLNHINSPQWPYYDFVFEYPPLMIFPLLLPKIVSESSTGYIRIFSLFVSLAVIICLLIALKFPLQKSLKPERFLVLSATTLFMLGIILVTRLDIYPSCLTLLAIYLYLKDRIYLAPLVLGLAVMTKVYPLVLAPLFLMDLLFRHRGRAALSAGLVFVLTLVAVNLPFCLVGAEKYFGAFLFHSQRGIQLESLYASGALLWRMLTDYPVQILFSSGSANLLFPHSVSMIKLSTYLSLLTFAAIYLRFFWLGRTQQEEENRKRLLVNTSVLLILAFIITFKVFSPQFLIWLFPIIFLVEGRGKLLILFSFICACALSQLIYPLMYSSLIHFSPPTVYALLLRNGLMFFIFLLLFLQDDRKRL